MSPSTSRIPDLTDVIAPRPRSDDPAGGRLGGRAAGQPLSEYERERLADLRHEIDRDGEPDE